MAKVLSSSLKVASSLLKRSPSLNLSSLRPIVQAQESGFSSARDIFLPDLPNPSWVFRNFSHGTVNLVISGGKLKFETHEVEPPKKYKWRTKKRFKMKKKKEKEKRKAANRKDPRRLTVKRKTKQKFANTEERIKFKLERAKIKEALLIERLKRYEVPKAQGPEVQPHNLTGEERFFIKKMAQKKSNYVPVGRRGIFGGVILNMHMHWKKHETVKVILNSCKPGQLQEYAQEIARLSGGFPIQTIGDDTVVFYRGKNYVQPKVMSPVETLSKKKAYERSKYEQSLETVRHFIAVAEKELELYYRHVALYGDHKNRDYLYIQNSSTDDSKESWQPKRLSDDLSSSPVASDTEADSTYQELSGTDDGIEDEDLLATESDADDDTISYIDDEERLGNSSMADRSLYTIMGSSTTLEDK